MKVIIAATAGLLSFPTLGGQIQYTDVTEPSGVRFVHENGATGKKYLPETMGSGCAFFDFDGDGWLDIFFVNSGTWPGQKKKSSPPALYRNNQDGTFTDVTRKAGLAVDFYGMGVAAADYDNDGDTDLFISGLGADLLFRNEGDGTFRDVTGSSGVKNEGFGTSAAWLDYDRDGHLDLFVANYVQWTLEDDIFCTLDGTSKSYCTPESYPGAAPRLFRNLGTGKFQNVTESAGLEDNSNKGLGVLVFDYNLDGWQDIMLANDTVPNKLWENNQNGTFTEVGILAGVALSEDGVARGAMGIDAGDYDRSGHPSIVIGNFSNEMIALYHNEGTGFFIDEAPVSTVGPASLLTLSFSCFFFDFNLDGLLDIYSANGHVENDINAVQKGVTYRQPPHLFQNLDGKKFQEVTARMGESFAAPRVARGAAYGDYDNDGDLDLLVTTCGGAARLFRNDGGNQNHWISLKLIGVSSNRDGIGARVRLRAGGVTQTGMIRTGGSYCSQSQLRLTFGLGTAAKVDLIEIDWPSGRKQTLRDTAGDRLIEIREGSE
jgi:hypothetical protein